MEEILIRKGREEAVGKKWMTLGNWRNGWKEREREKEERRGVVRGSEEEEKRKNWKGSNWAIEGEVVENGREMVLKGLELNRLGR